MFRETLNPKPYLGCKGFSGTFCLMASFVAVEPLKLAERPIKAPHSEAAVFLLCFNGGVPGKYRVIYRDV